MQHRLDDAKRTAYYRQQASACATAAIATAIAEVKQAYLDLEQGWRSLAPKVEETPAVSARAETTDDADLQTDRASGGNASREDSRR